METRKEFKKPKFLLACENYVNRKYPSSLSRLLKLPSSVSESFPTATEDNSSIPYMFVLQTVARAVANQHQHINKYFEDLMLRRQPNKDRLDKVKLIAEAVANIAPYFKTFVFTPTIAKSLLTVLEEDENSEIDIDDIDGKSVYVVDVKTGEGEIFTAKVNDDNTVSLIDKDSVVYPLPDISELKPAASFEPDDKVPAAIADTDALSVDASSISARDDDGEDVRDMDRSSSSDDDNDDYDDSDMERSAAADDDDDDMDMDRYSPDEEDRDRDMDGASDYDSDMERSAKYADSAGDVSDDYEDDEEEETYEESFTRNRHLPSSKVVETFLEEFENSYLKNSLANEELSPDLYTDFLNKDWFLSGDDSPTTEIGNKEKVKDEPNKFRFPEIDLDPSKPNKLSDKSADDLYGFSGMNV